MEKPGSLNVFPLSRTVAWSTDSESTRQRNRNDHIMTEKAYENHVGIDVSKAKLDIAFSAKGKIISCPNNEKAIKELINKLPTSTSTLIVMEATGGYERLAARLLKKQGYNVAVVNAKRVRDFAKAKGTIAKTDSIDARIIFLFGKTFNPKAQPLESDELEQQQNYLQRRDQVVRMITLEKQYLEHAVSPIREEINKHIASLNKQLAALESKLEASIQKDEVLKERIERLDEIKSVGNITAMNVLLNLPELGTLSHKEITALVGLAPFNKDSGKTEGRRKTQGGRARVRAALYMAVLSAKKYNIKIKIFYDRLLAKGKLKKVALIACMRKLLIIMNAMMRDSSQWSPGN